MNDPNTARKSFDNKRLDPPHPRLERPLPDRQLDHVATWVDQLASPQFASNDQSSRPSDSSATSANQGNSPTKPVANGDVVSSAPLNPYAQSPQKIVRQGAEASEETAEHSLTSWSLRQAEQLSQWLLDRQRELDRREAALNARQALQESHERSFRLLAREQLRILAERETELRCHKDLEDRQWQQMVWLRNNATAD